MGMVYKRGNIWWIKYYRTGKPYMESSRSKKEVDAKRLLKKREGEIAVGKLPGIYFDKIKIDDLVQGYLTDYKINGKKSLSAAENNINHLSEFFEGIKVVDITTPIIHAYIEYRFIAKGDVEKLLKEGKSLGEIADILETTFSNIAKFFNSLEKPYRAKNGASNATINRELAALKRMLNLGARQTPPIVDKVPYIPMLKENNRRKGFFEHGDFLSLREELPEYLKGLVTFAYKVGWRVSEISNLRWKQVDLKQGIVRLEVGETKNNEARTVYLDEELKEVFNNQWELRKERSILIQYVFPNEDSTDRVKDFRKSWATACKDAQLGKRYFHDFRRTAIRNMVRAGVPEGVAMMVSGHKTRSVFERYNIVSASDLKLAAQKQELYLQSQDGNKKVTIHDFDKKKDLAK